MRYVQFLQDHCYEYRTHCGRSRWLWLFFPIIVLFLMLLAFVDWLVERKRKP